jgi:hypothetical protein
MICLLGTSIQLEFSNNINEKAMFMNTTQLTALIATISRLRREGRAHSYFKLSVPDNTSEKEIEALWVEVRKEINAGIMEKTLNQINHLTGEGLTNSEELRLWVKEMARNEMALSAIAELDLEYITWSWWPERI